jgi:NAD(P)H-flavin reductase
MIPPSAPRTPYGNAPPCEGRGGTAGFEDPLRPTPAVIRARRAEIGDVATFYLEFADASHQERYRCAPGQFNMLYMPGIGEVPISVSHGLEERRGIGHTIRFVGRVTRAMDRLREGDVIGVRGPYGQGWPVDRAPGRDVLIVAGGLGLAPLRPVVTALLAMRTAVGRVVLLYGARQPPDLLFQSEYPDWEQRGLEILTTVDRADERWQGRVGVVPILLRKLDVDPARTLVMVCGPEVMMRYSVAETLGNQISGDDIYVSLERNMQCAVALCGHCQLGPEFLCQDGPVFPYARVARFLNQKNM